MSSVVRPPVAWSMALTGGAVVTTVNPAFEQISHERLFRRRLSREAAHHDRGAGRRRRGGFENHGVDRSPTGYDQLRRWIIVGGVGDQDETPAAIDQLGIDAGDPATSEWFAGELPDFDAPLDTDWKQRNQIAIGIPDRDAVGMVGWVLRRTAVRIDDLVGRSERQPIHEWRIGDLAGRPGFARWTDASATAGDQDQAQTRSAGPDCERFRGRGADHRTSGMARLSRRRTVPTLEVKAGGDDRPGRPVQVGHGHQGLRIPDHRVFHGELMRFQRGSHQGLGFAGRGGLFRRIKSAGEAAGSQAIRGRDVGVATRHRESVGFPHDGTRDHLDVVELRVVGDHRANHLQLLPVLFSEDRRRRPDLFKESSHHEAHPTEEMGPSGIFQLRVFRDIWNGQACGGGPRCSSSLGIEGGLCGEIHDVGSSLGRRVERPDRATAGRRRSPRSVRTASG